MRWKTELLYSFVDLVNKFKLSILHKFYLKLLQNGGLPNKSMNIIQFEDLIDFYILHKEDLVNQSKKLSDYIIKNFDVTNSFKENIKCNI